MVDGALSMQFSHLLANSMQTRPKLMDSIFRLKLMAFGFGGGGFGAPPETPPLILAALKQIIRFCRNRHRSAMKTRNRLIFASITKQAASVCVETVVGKGG